MKFEIMSRNDILKYSKEDHSNEKSMVISISDHGQTHPQIFKSELNGIEHIIFLHFDDIEREDLIAYPQCVPISSNDARTIANFVIRNKDAVDKIIVHCGAGISRSSGVCAAIMKFITGNDEVIFNSARFCPNMTCYRLCLNALMGYKTRIEKVESELKEV